MKPFYSCVNFGRNKLYYRGIDKDGNRIDRTVSYKPTLYKPVENETKFKSLDGQNLKPVEYKDMNGANAFKKKYKDVEGFKIYGQLNFINQFIRERHPEDIKFDISKLCIASIDIETECENGFPDIKKAEEEITCLTLYDSLSKTYWVFSNEQRDKLDITKFEKYKTNGENVVAIECYDEREMMRQFLNKWSVDLKFPNIISGYNCETFDIPYLVQRLYNIFTKDYVDNKLSPWGKVESEEIQGMYGRVDTVYRISGVSVMDYMVLYKKFRGIPRENYKLDTIASVELGEAKLSYEEYDNMHTFYLEDYPTFVEYNVKDVWLLNRMEDKLKLMEFAITVAYMAKVNYGDVYFPVRMIESLCYDHLLSKNIVMDAKNKDSYKKKESYVGGHVKEPQLGMHEWVVSFDLDSLYPNVILQENLSPETLVPELHNKDVSVDSMLAGSVDLTYLEEKNVTVACNGHHFTREKIGFLPEIINKLIVGRTQTKSEMLEAERNLIEVEEEIKKRLNDKN